jgi:hypothetical protein
MAIVMVLLEVMLLICLVDHSEKRGLKSVLIVYQVFKIEALYG